MTKQELVQRVAGETGLSGSDVKSAVDATFDAIASELSNGGEVSIPGFGKFSVTERAARQGRNPATGEAIEIAASKSAKFSSASGLKKAVNG